MSDADLIQSLARAAEGIALALQNRHKRLEMLANLEYAEANIRHILKDEPWSAR